MNDYSINPNQRDSSKKANQKTLFIKRKSKGTIQQKKIKRYSRSPLNKTDNMKFVEKSLKTRKKTAKSV